MDKAGLDELAAVMAAIEVTPAGFPVVLVGSPALLHEARDMVASAGGGVVAELDWPAIGADWLAPATPALFVLDGRGVADERLAIALPPIAALDAPVVVNVDHAAIDVVAATLFGPRVQILCEAAPADQAIALTVAARSIGHDGLHDNRAYENEAARLQRLNEEVARIAEVLARLSQREPSALRNTPAEVFDRRQSFEIKPIHDITIDASEIRRAIKGRRLRDQFFGNGLFEEPGWDCLLDLFAAELEGTRVSVSSLCIAAAVAPTTALRWISKLTEVGLLERRPDPFDRRRAFMELSERASRAMRDYIAAMRRAGLSLA